MSQDKSVELESQRILGGTAKMLAYFKFMVEPVLHFRNILERAGTVICEKATAPRKLLTSKGTWTGDVN